MIVREATLDDTQDIVAIHLTNPDRPFDQPIESLSIKERCDYGGPWMSLETCAIHLNNLLAWGNSPLVVEDEGRVIAETEFYIGRDIPPLGRTLDISVIFVHSDFQRRGAGTLLMEEMISTGKKRNCHYITVSGCMGAPKFYDRFGFAHLFDLVTLECDVPRREVPCSCNPYIPADFEGPPDKSLWIGRYLSPYQKWLEIVNGMKKRDAILPEHATWPEPIGRSPGKHGFLGFLVPDWKDQRKVDIYCWAERLEGGTVLELLAHANLAGYVRASLLCCPDVVQLVSRICESESSGTWSISGKRL